MLSMAAAPVAACHRAKTGRRREGAPGAHDIDKLAVRRIFQQVYMIASSKPVVKISWRIPLIAAVLLEKGSDGGLGCAIPSAACGLSGSC